MKRAIKYTCLAVVMLLIAGVVAPFIRVDQYREQIRESLQRTLHRKVDIYGDTRLNLFRGPGFSVEKVVIHDDPSVGLEPMANVPELQLTVGISSLWKGRFVFSTVRLVEPSLNIVKPDDGVWNIAPLLAGAALQRNVSLPEIQVSNGRLNFKFGDTKSAFYLTNADLSIYPSDNGFHLRFSLAPARTDRSAQGYGVFSGYGRWSNGQVDLDLQLERSSIEELVTLARGSSLGLHGRIWSRAKLTGPVSNVEVNGRFDIEDVHRWDLIDDRASGVAMNYRGKLDFGSQRLEIVADKRANPAARSEVKLVVDDLMYHPKWSVELMLNRVPAAAVVDAARHVGAPIPGHVGIDGDALGVVAYNSTEGVQGQIAFENALVRFNQGLEFRLPSASVLISGDEVRLLPATLSVAQGRSAQLQATYAPFGERIQARLTGRGLAIAELQNGRGHLLDGAGVPVVNQFRGGTWSGTLDYVADRGVPGAWTANLSVADTVTDVPGLGRPFRINTADLSMVGRRLTVRRLHGSIGDTQVLGEYRYVPGVDRPDRFALSIPSIEAAELEHTLGPTLRRDSSFLSRTFRLRDRTFEWLRTRKAEGSVRIGKLIYGDHVMRGIRSKIVWDGTEVEVSSFEARMDDALIRSAITADLSRGEPVYKMRGTIDRLKWGGGRVDIEGSLETRGTGAGLLLNMKATGEYAARSVVISPELALTAVAGTFDFAGSRSGPQMKLTVADALVGEDRYSGKGVTQADGRLHMDLASGTHVMRLRGAVLPLQLEVAPDRIAP